jgi:PhzF family phenazine biosynthesis protein
VELPIYQVDAFAREVFRGNPAAVCPLPHWLPEETMQQIAAENNLAETAFFVGAAGRYDLRWFTPTIEMDLCGHATLASALVVFRFMEPALDSVVFDSRSGPLTVTCDGDDLALDFPTRHFFDAPAPAGLGAALGRQPAAVRVSHDLIAIYDTEAEVRSLEPDMEALLRLEGTHRGIIVTAPGEEVDFVSRFFAPGAGIPEDPATGSSHCLLAPYWAERLGKNRLHARQLSPRGGEISCELQGDRVRISGGVVLYLKGTIFL